MITVYVVLNVFTPGSGIFQRILEFLLNFGQGAVIFYQVFLSLDHSNGVSLFFIVFWHQDLESLISSILFNWSIVANKPGPLSSTPVHTRTHTHARTQMKR